MAIDPTSLSTPAAPGTQTTNKNASLGKDDFLKLLVAQLSHQDPLSPQTDTAFVAQLAQFAQLEQSQNQSTTLSQIQTSLLGQK